MQVFAGHRAVPRLAAPAIAIGNFDGVHRGHQVLLARARAAADRLGGTALAMTFDPHPTAVLAPHVAPVLLTSERRKLELIAAHGADGCIIEPFTAALAALEPEAFIDRVLVDALGVKHVVVGWDFTYGQGRRGTTATLAEHGARAGFTVDVVDKVMIEGDVASSTRIRNYLRAGELAAARRLLGRPWDVDGTVVHGAGRGKGLGIPTANVAPEAALLVAPGIHAVTLQILDDDGDALPLPAVASLGTNPTFVEQGGLVLEVYVLDFDRDIYDRRVRVAFIEKLRDERKFDSVDALLAQIHQDVADARTALAT